MSIKFEWEMIYDDEVSNNSFSNTYRAKVIGGWVLRHENLIDSSRK